MYNSEEFRPAPFWRKALFRVVGWGMITFAVFSFVLSMVGEWRTPRISEDEARRSELAAEPGP